MFVTGCVKFDRVGRGLSGSVIVLVAASIALGRIILESGAADWIGGVECHGGHRGHPNSFCYRQQAGSSARALGPGCAVRVQFVLRNAYRVSDQYVDHGRGIL